MKYTKLGNKNGPDYTLDKLRHNLQKAGLTSIENVAQASPERISEATGLTIVQSKQIYAMASAKIQNTENEYSSFTSANDLDHHTILPIPTGSSDLDGMLGGGIEFGSVTHFYGGPATGKTQLCHTLCVLLPLPYQVMYIDTENKFRPERVQSIAKLRNLDVETILKRIHVTKPLNTQQQELRIEVISNLMQKSDSTIRLLIVDSMTSLYRVDYSGRARLSDKQQKLNQYMHKLSMMAQTNNIAVVITNQVQYTPDNPFGTNNNRPVPIGAQIMLYASTHTISLSGSNPERILARLANSPCLPPTDTSFEISEGGVVNTGAVDINSNNKRKN